MTSSLDIELLPASELRAEHVESWLRLQRANPRLDSPFLRPEFTALVDEVRDDVEVAVLRENATVRGFLAFHRGAGNVGQPVGGELADLQAIVGGESWSLSAAELLEGLGLVAWHFDHLVHPQQPFTEHCQYLDDAPYIDLAEGFAAYRESRLESGSSLWPQLRRKARKLERERGPVRFEYHVESEELLETLLRWKSEQLRRQGLADVFRFDWARQLTRRLVRAQSIGFAGVLSALYVGEEPVAAHLGLRSGPVLASWVPAYSERYGRYSPGALLHLELAREAAERGVRRIDLGRGENRLKTQLASGAVPLAVGSVDSRPLRRVLTLGWYRLRKLAHSTDGGRRALRSYRRLRNWKEGFDSEGGSSGDPRGSEGP